MIVEFFERSVIWNGYKTKSENKNTINEYRYLIESNFLGVSTLFGLVYSNNVNASKRYSTFRYYFRKAIIDNCNVIFNGKNFMTNQLILI